VFARTTRLKLGGVMSLRIKQGATPSFTLTGDKQRLAMITVSQSGDTLIVDTKKGNWNFGSEHKHELRAELTLPALSEVDSHGVGSTDVQGFTGNSLKLNVDGAGAITVQGRYKQVNARLGGVGSLKLDAGDSERIDLAMQGAGAVTAKGRTKVLKATLGGVGGLDAKQLQADSVELDMNGLGGATVFAASSANLNLSGLGSATVFGKPATRHASARGLGSVSWQ
jgi:hypothetical protein